jgi:hypothetical protein
MTTGPCGWVPTHTHHSATDLAEWNAYAAATRTMADSIASMVLWSATGRRYGACATIARPVLLCCHVSQADLAANPYYPTVLDSGDWVNLPSCGLCRTDLSRARLRGPVVAVTSVTIDGVVFNPLLYRIDEGEWLVRTDGGIWPAWQDVSLASGGTGTFVVSYTLGETIPAGLLAAAGTYALEWARASSPQSSTLCRLPSRAKDIVRQGVSISMVDPTILLEHQLTGLPEIDGLITALNSTRQIRSPRVLVPCMDAPVVSA